MPASRIPPLRLIYVPRPSRLVRRLIWTDLPSATMPRPLSSRPACLPAPDSSPKARGALALALTPTSTCSPQSPVTAPTPSSPPARHAPPSRRVDRVTPVAATPSRGVFRPSRARRPFPGLRAHASGSDCANGSLDPSERAGRGTSPPRPLPASASGCERRACHSRPVLDLVPRRYRYDHTRRDHGPLGDSSPQDRARGMRSPRRIRRARPPTKNKALVLVQTQPW